MLDFALLVSIQLVFKLIYGLPPQATLMAAVGALALAGLFLRSCISVLHAARAAYPVSPQASASISEGHG